MESNNRIENLLERYFEGKTSLAEERELESYFTGSQIAPAHIQFAPLFQYYSNSRKDATNAPVFKKNSTIRKLWIGLAASVVGATGIALYLSQYNPADRALSAENEAALLETQKALDLLASNLNRGVESVSYVAHYQQTKRIVFKD
jgi:hypothetical protein